MKTRTISKNFDDSEVLFKGANGDIHLKVGVTRLGYNTHINPEELESHINQQEMAYRKQIELIDLLERDWDND